VQNEPEATQPWESCVYTPEGERNFVNLQLGPRLRQDHPGLQIMGYDHNKDHLIQWSDTLLGSGGASQYVDGVAFHWYSGPCFEHVQTVASKYVCLGNCVSAKPHVFVIHVSSQSASERECEKQE
jgi:glucosylceramidase